MMNDYVQAPVTPLVREASKLPRLLSSLQTHIAAIRQCSHLIPEGVHQELNFVIEETVSDVSDLVRVIAVQKELTGVDPLDPAAKAAPSTLSEDEDDEFDQTPYAEPEGPLSEEAKQLLLTVFAAYDSLNSKQVAGLAHAAKCSNQQVRSFFSDMRTQLRNVTTAAIRRANKAADQQHQQQQQQQLQGPDQAAAGPGAGKYGQPRLPTHHHHHQQHHQQGVLSPQNSLQSQLLSSQHQQQQNQGLAMSLSWQGSLDIGSAAAVPAAGEGQQAASELGPTCAAIAANISAQQEKLSKIVDQQHGAITSGGRFLGALSSITTWSGRTAALAALAASYTPINNSSSVSSRPLSGAGSSGGASAAVRGQLSSSRLLDVIEGWLKEAAADKQITFLAKALQVLCQVRLSSALLQGSSISHTVQELAAHTNKCVAAAAQQLLDAWAAATGNAAAVAGKPGSKQQQQHFAAPGDLIALGGNRQVTANYKRKVNLAVKRKIDEMELVGDLKRGPAGTLISAPAAAGAAAAAAQPVVAAADAGGPGNPAAGAAHVTSGQLKRPSKRPQSAAAGAGGSAAAAGSGAVSEAARRLATLHSLNRSGPQQQRQRHQQSGPQTLPQLLAALPPDRRLWSMAPAGRAAAPYIAAAGPWAAEVTQATQEYDKAVHRWLTHRIGASLREQDTATAAMQLILQQRQQEAADGGSSSSTGEWSVPPAVPAEAFSQVAAGQESQIAQDAASVRWLQQLQQQPDSHQQQQQQSPPPEPDECPAVGSAASGGGAAVAMAGGAAAPRRIPFHPTNPSEELTQRCWMWAHGIRLPMHIVKPPTTAEYNRAKQKVEEQQLQSQQQQQQLQQPAVQYAAPAVQQGHLAQPIQQQYRQQQQQQPQQPVAYAQQPYYQQHLLQQQQQQQGQQQQRQHGSQVGVQASLGGYSGYGQQQQQPIVIVVPAGQPPPAGIVIQHGTTPGVQTTQHAAAAQHQQQQQQHVHGYHPQGY